MSAIYWSYGYRGLWLAPNPLPGQTTDTLFQFEREAIGDLPQVVVPLLGRRADWNKMFRDALPAGWYDDPREKLRPFFRSEGHRVGSIMMLHGDPEFRYWLQIWFHSGIRGGDNRDDSRGITMRLDRDEPPAPGRKNRTTHEVWRAQANRPELKRMLDKSEVPL